MKVGLESRLEGDASTARASLGVRMLAGAERIHVLLVVLLVVELHDLAGDDRLERIVRVGWVRGSVAAE